MSCRNIFVIIQHSNWYNIFSSRLFSRQSSSRCCNAVFNASDLLLFAVGCWHNFSSDLVHNRRWWCRAVLQSQRHIRLARCGATQSSAVNAACPMHGKRAKIITTMSADDNNAKYECETRYTCAINKIELNAFIHIIRFAFSHMLSVPTFVCAKWIFFCASDLNIVNRNWKHGHQEHNTHVFCAKYVFYVRIVYSAPELRLQDKLALYCTCYREQSGVSCDTSSAWSRHVENDWRLSLWMTDSAIR